MKKNFLMIVLIILTFTAQTVYAKTILYVPQDNRPVSFSYVVDTAKATGAEVITPQTAIIADRTNPGNPDYLWDWVFSHCNDVDAIVVSADALLYGSLVASRIHNFPEDVLKKRLANFEKLKQINPSARLYVYSTIMRTPKDSAGGVEPDYYEVHGPNIFTITALQDKSELEYLSPNEQLTLHNLIATVPHAALSDWFGRRAKNYRINVGLITYTKNNTFDYLIQGRDDCSPYSRSHKESRMLAGETKTLPASKYATFPGADQLGMLLVTRAINDFNFQAPIVAVIYAPGEGGKTVPSYEDKEIDQTISDQIISAGGIPLPAPGQPDLVLAVNTPENGITLEANNPANKKRTQAIVPAFVNRLETYLAAGKQVSVADIAFANGADNTFMNSISRRGLLTRLAAYSGWNTASNTIGYAIGQGMLANKMTTAAKNRLLAVRLLDDWAYQANVRGEVAEAILWPLGGNYFYLDGLKTNLTEDTEHRLRLFAEKNLNGLSINSLQVTFPWNRMFEIDVTVE